MLGAISMYLRKDHAGFCKDLHSVCIKGGGFAFIA
jgi:hypothetical protein